MKIKSICCIGAGYVGGPTMAVIALKCPHINVTVVDANPDKIKAWNGPLDNIPVYEPGLAEVVKEARGRNLFFSDDIAGNIEKSEMIFMAVNTPTKTEGEGAGMAADLCYVESCSRDIANYSKSDKIVIEKSTLPVRTAEKIKEILDENSKGIHFEILSNPEFLAEGTAIQDLFKSDRVLIGGDDTDSGQNAVQALVEIYSNWIPKEKILTTNVWSSELAKLASNAMLAQRVSSINSLSAICEKTGASIEELSKAIGMDHRIGPHFLKSSVGFGGSCFQKDILNMVYLCRKFGLDEVAEYWHQVVKINDYQKNRFAQKIIDHFGGDLTEKRVTILGWSFKANTNDSRESAAIFVTERLYNAGATLEIYDPMVPKNIILDDIKAYWTNIDESKFLKSRLIFLEEPKQKFKKRDIVAILTEWEEFKSYDYSQATLFDGRNLIK
ncbi:MAG: nucleotide sugar dehydrogenase [Flavobacteriales bacterium TMED235]|nr:MAG: nucleotide sugar dehydrogenase [Flavobacteriales bacterium TMED235]|tara:strand:- start:3387 stop:4709 length:1323 start_codon:yes stop_codon:yes gene_type:complete